MKSVKSSSFLGQGTKSNRVAQAIERDIIEGKLLPGSSLKSLRDMAADLGVSQVVISEAMGILERKNLVTRLPRKGIFVKSPQQDKDLREVVLFAMDRNPNQNVFVNEVLQLRKSKHTQNKINFTMRLTSTGNKSAIGNLDQEILKMEKFGFPDCALIIPIGFSRKDVERVLRLPYPVIFLGDFAEGDYNDLNYIRIANSRLGNYQCFINYVKEQNLSHFSYLYPEYLCSSYLDIYFKELTAFANEQGIECSPVLIPGVTWEEAAENFKKIYPTWRKDVGNQELLADLYFKLPPMDKATENIVYLHHVDSYTLTTMNCSMDEFFEKICEVIFNIEKYRNKKNIIMVDNVCQMVNYSKK